MKLFKQLQCYFKIYVQVGEFLVYMQAISRLEFEARNKSVILCKANVLVYTFGLGFPQD